MTIKNGKIVSNDCCQHELIIKCEYWISERTVQIDAECQRCLTKFYGILNEKYDN